MCGSAGGRSPEGTAVCGCLEAVLPCVPEPHMHRLRKLPRRSNGNKLTWQSCEYGDSLTWADAVDAELAKKGINTSKYK